MPNVNPGVASASNTNREAVINGMQLLWRAQNVNMQASGDQYFTKYWNGNQWDPYFIVITYVSGAFSGSCQGGIFSLPNRAGSVIMPSTTSMSPLTGPLTHQNAAITSSTTTFTDAPYFNITVANGAPLFADILIYGFSYE